VAGQPGPLPLARKRIGADRCPPRRCPAPAAPRTPPSRTGHVPYGRAGRAGRHAPGAPAAGEKGSRARCRNAAHCPGWPLQGQGHPKIVSDRFAETIFGTHPLVLETSASSAGLTARARPKARPETRGEPLYRISHLYKSYDIQSTQPSRNLRPPHITNCSAVKCFATI
jgi:hypothetical protein